INHMIRFAYYTNSLRDHSQKQVRTAKAILGRDPRRFLAVIDCLGKRLYRQGVTISTLNVLESNTARSLPDFHVYIWYCVYSLSIFASPCNRVTFEMTQRQGRQTTI